MDPTTLKQQLSEFYELSEIYQDTFEIYSY